VRKLIQILTIVLLLVQTPSLSADDPAKSADTHPIKSGAQQDSKMAWWREAKFGMFVHWGIYSVVGGQYKGQKLPNSAEWMMNKGEVPIVEYEKYAAQFNPTEFDATEFVARAKRAGMKYLVITAKHHDGFSMFGSKATPYNVVDATPFKRDIMKELAVACREQGIRFGFYYSQCQDWHHPGGLGNHWDKTLKKVSFDEYVRDKAVPEIKQLLTEYGPVSIFWWDTPRKMSKESFDSLHSLTGLQPGVITNDRLGKDTVGDHKTYERSIPPQGPINGQDWEVCMPISGSWGYKKSDTDFKSEKKLIQNLADIASKGGNYLLNVSPTGTGALLPQATERLEAIGRWMDVNKESIHGTTASPIGKPDWGRCTKKVFPGGATLYLQVFDWPKNGSIVVPGLKNKVKQCYLMSNWNALKTESVDDGVKVSLPTEATDPNVSVIVMHVEGDLDVEAPSLSPDADGKLVLSASTAYIHNNEGSKEASLRNEDKTPNIGYWTDKFAWLEWTITIKEAGTFEVFADVAIEAETTAWNFGLRDQQQVSELKTTGGYGNYETRSLGTIKIEKTGALSFRINPVAEKWQPVNLRKVELKLKK